MCKPVTFHGMAGQLRRNTHWEAWGEYLDDHLGATAIIDRLLHRSHVIVIDGPSDGEWVHRQQTEAPNNDG